ncbi:hypothetical protein RY831_32160 [Noviherbaspirillum sp. CPCC 100848]|uniref:Uncharacterized protein n=1 Tax=Noviherbaspirillum album TaxID=3080276 RepID=A0ABU6JJC4_9BURK|nr:hypothetical protein [Noviherbaspirillum sp. CPCC 100848]MEC4723776.1 hypothetical protein [Noviherbaspirillum sp. CPCC 100848]
MNQRMYKNLRLGGAMIACTGALALKLEAHVFASAFLAVGVLVFFSGLVGAWFNDG